MKKSELVFIPSPGAGHLISTVESAKLLVDHNDRLSITILIMKFPFDKKVTTYTESLAASNLSSRIKFITLPDDQPDKESPHSKDSFNSFMENKKPQVKEAVSKLTESPDSPPLAGFVLDMFCTCMIDVANELQVPSYIFFTSSAAFLGFLFQVQALNDEENIVITELKDSDAVLEIPSLMNSVPSKVWPTVLFQKEWVGMLYELARRFRGVKGIIVNTFEELESYALRSFPSGRSKTPPVYAVGPILNIKGENYDLGSGGGADKKADIMTWLDDQPESSVVFLCFGSMGSFGEDQIKEIACALEQSGHRFLWSLRRAPSKDKKFEMPSDYTDPTEVLPEGFFDRTAKIGKVIGWAPQVDVLRHPAIGGFVSHCGWNSTLESIWFGVPIATWPIYAEQQFNAFELVVELGLAVEIRMDYRQDFTVDNPTVVSAQEIERGIGCLMERNSEMRKRVKEMSEKARKTLMDGGSSFSSVGRLIDDVFDNIA